MLLNHFIMFLIEIILKLLPWIYVTPSKMLLNLDLKSIQLFAIDYTKIISKAFDEFRIQLLKDTKDFKKNIRKI